MIVPIGQDRILNFFRQLINDGRLGHAYMLCGGAGCGKKTLCRYITSLAMCSSHTACGSCNGCLTVTSGANPDVIYISNDDKASIGVDKIRTLIGKMYVRPLVSDKKIFIIDNAHLLTTGAQNALLKAIEEPPSYAVFFLLCDSTASILDTIMSRVARIDVPPLSAEHLRTIAPGCQEFLYHYCTGNPGRLIEIKDDGNFAKMRNRAVEAMGAVISDNGFDMYEYADLFEGDRQKANTAFDIMLMFVRDVILCKNGLDTMVINKDKINEIKEFSSSVTAMGAARIAETISAAPAQMGKGGSIAMAWQAMFIKCREVINDRSSRYTL